MNRKISKVVGRIGTFTALSLLTAWGQAQAATRFSLPAQPMADSLRAVGTQTNTNVLFDPDLVGAMTAPALDAELTRDQALAQLLSGTSLTYELLSERTAVVAPLRVVHVLNSQATSSNSQGASSQMRLAQAESNTTSHSGTAAQQSKPEDAPTEVIVTAQKRSERLQDVPVPVTSIRADNLVNNNQQRLQEYYMQVPGLSLTSAAQQPQGAPELSIRGVSTGGGVNPTVGIAIDDVPFGSSTALGWGYVMPDIDPNELVRVEVLRGPQGTLYGVSSIGGLLKFVTVDPSTSKFEGRVQGGVNSVANGDDAGYSVRGSVNIPLSDTWAVRASGFTRRDPGYIDNVQTGERDVNRVDASGGRLSALWRPSTDLSLKLSALTQDNEAEGASYINVQAGLGDLEQSALRGTGGYRIKAQAYSATLNASFGDVDLTSVSGYGRKQLASSLDVPIFSPLSELVFGVAGTLVTNDNETTKFSQEVRVSTPLGSKADWLVGAFYTHEDSENWQEILAANENTGVPTDQWVYNDLPTTFEEYAAFTDFTFHLTDRFDLQIGGRESQNEQTYSQLESGIYVPLFVGMPSPLVQSEVRTKEDAFTYLVTPQFKVSPDLMVYMRLASGYRAGGPNVLSTINNLPTRYAPDKTQNYEIGVKGSLFNRALSFDVSLYHIDWRDIQLSLLANGNTYFVNASRARSRGAEFAVESRPLAGMSISTWVAWNDAELTEGFPAGSAVYGAEGDRLPSSSRFSGNISLDKEFPLWNEMTGFLGGSVSYVGTRTGNFQSTPLRQEFPAYAKTDVRAGMTYDTWTMNLYVNNVTDRRGLLGGGLDLSFVPGAFNYIQPRTAGVSLSKTF